MSTYVLHFDSLQTNETQGDGQALDYESKAQREQLGLFEGVTIKTHPGKARRSVLVEVFPPPPKKVSQFQSIS